MGRDKVKRVGSKKGQTGHTLKDTDTHRQTHTKTHTQCNNTFDRFHINDSDCKIYTSRNKGGPYLIQENEKKQTNKRDIAYKWLSLE